MCGHHQWINTWRVAYEQSTPTLTSVHDDPDDQQRQVSDQAQGCPTSDAPDAVALEAAFVKRFVESDFLKDLGSLLPYAQEDQTYTFVTDVGNQRWRHQGLCLSGYPGALFYRRSLAKEYFGTDDPAEIQALLSDFDKYTEAAAVVKEKSGGDTYMVASSGDFQNPFFANRSSRGLLMTPGRRSDGPEIRYRQVVPRRRL